MKHYIVSGLFFLGFILFLFSFYTDHVNNKNTENKITELRDSIRSCENFIYHLDSLRTERFKNLITDSLKTEKFRILIYEQTRN
jgi:hypothetical protein